MEISEKTTIAEAIKKSKGVLNVLTKHNLYCAGCRGSVNDTLEIVAENNGLDVKKFLEEIRSSD